MTLNQLRAFLAAARSGSFTAAAEEMRMSQASVSELVRRLEEEYHLPLFTRQPRRLVLTTAGEALLSYAEQSVAAADSADEALLALRSLGGGVATFGVLRNADYYFLTDLVKEFHQAYPKVHVRLVGQNSVDVAASVAAGQLEAGLVVLPIDDAGLRVRPLLRDEVLFASADPERLTDPMTTRRLAEARLILYDAHYGWRDPTRRQLAERAQLEGVKLDAMIEVEHVEAALRLVARGVGDTFISRAVAESSAFPDGVGTVAFAEPLYDTIALVQRESAVLSPATAEIARLAQGMLLARAR
ncbi:LysR family transcriptional regulator [Actinoplanes bogorensis]|uniref:LysR family transcriptional regulator n=1 Tax=Paractinoplanes bogorensis TaxID=1610840 RepID=A0ABS5YXG4_9ACTN|nr:LysR family transcriptional regulator [Actinoplanes bogorensis]MBU2668132.1 LysR family transcriptional regulator [Actinoplanes bogorensis]